MKAFNNFLLTIIVALCLFLPFHVEAIDLFPDPNAGTFINQQAQPCEIKNTVAAPVGPSAALKEDVPCTIKRISNRIISIIFYLMGAIAVLLLIYSGIQYTQSNGNPEGIKKSRATITNVVLGIIILTAAYAIINLIAGAVGHFTPAI